MLPLRRLGVNLIQIEFSLVLSSKEVKMSGEKSSEDISGEGRVTRSATMKKRAEKPAKKVVPVENEGDMGIKNLRKRRRRLRAKRLLSQ